MQGRRRGGIGQPASPGAVTVGDRRLLYLLSRSSDRREWPPLGPPGGGCSPARTSRGSVLPDTSPGRQDGRRLGGRSGSRVPRTCCGGRISGPAILHGWRSWLDPSMHGRPRRRPGARGEAPSSSLGGALRWRRACHPEALLPRMGPWKCPRDAEDRLQGEKLRRRSPRAFQQCPVSSNLARRHAADLRWARFAETASSWFSH
jgi:hypothetical protein